MASGRSWEKKVAACAPPGTSRHPWSVAPAWPPTVAGNMTMMTGLSRPAAIWLVAVAASCPAP